MKNGSYQHHIIWKRKFGQNWHSLSLLVIQCQLLSLVVTRCTTCCYSFSLVVTCCTTHCHSLSLVVIRCHSLYHSLSLVVTRCTTRLSFYKRSKKTMLIFLCNTKMKFCFWHMVIFLMLCNNKNISPWHNSFKSWKQKFGVTEKNFMFKKKLMLHKN